MIDEKIKGLELHKPYKYGDLCNIFNEAKKGGKSKQLQFKNWDRFMSIEKGKKATFIVKEIYDEPIPKIDNRTFNGGHYSIYDELMDDLLINFIIDNSEYEFSITFLDLFSLNGKYNSKIPIFSKYYVEMVGQGSEAYSKAKDLGKGFTAAYMEKTKKITDKCLVTSLNRLKRNGFIYDWKQDTMINDAAIDQFIADEDELEVIKLCEQEIYEEMEIKPFSRVNPKVNKKFKNKVCELINNKYIKNTDFYCITSYWKVYTIIVSDDVDFSKCDRKDTDIEELVFRFITQVKKAVRNKSATNEDEEKYFPYKGYKYNEQFEKLNSVIWNIKDDKGIADCGNEAVFEDNLPF